MRRPPPALRRNAANLIVLFRTVLIFAVIGLLESPSQACRMSGLLLLGLAALLDWADGWVARRLGVTSPVGGLLDTLGDRITENLLFVFLAWHRLVPLAVPLIFLFRSFVADFVRFLAWKRGIGTFAINSSRLGHALVASPASRALYLVSKLSVFFAGGAVLVLGDGVRAGPLGEAVWAGAVFAAGFNVVRFALLLWDGRNILKEEFLS